MPSASRIKCARLIDARISFESETETHGRRYLHMDVSSSAEFWWGLKQVEPGKPLGELDRAWRNSMRL